ncbi:MAG: hypothetical protein O9972_08105 [Burkholderiales bacterium]|nr:hypothetical protein [Burkholderiales bacterium]
MEPLILFGPSLILSAVILLALWEEGRPPRTRRLTRHRSPGPRDPVDPVAMQDRTRAAAEAA